MVAILGMGGALAQAPSAQPTQPTLTRPTVLALQTLREEMSQVQQDAAALDAMIKKEAPGYHLGNDLKVEKDQPSAKVEPKKEPAK